MFPFDQGGGTKCGNGRSFTVESSSSPSVTRARTTTCFLHSASSGVS